MTLNTDVRPASAASTVDDDRAPGVPSEREAHFDECFRSHYARVLAYAVRRLTDRSAAEDIAAETFLVAWRLRGASAPGADPVGPRARCRPARLR